ncbi:hypothetical protein AMK68_03830 [candidate division KD3-62 bacterium DG_56]|uniref:Uncharacterized protein n=1 Tax=candidate division KD3-62 bacterium DG_56 TaxID=1704032 RepID=A0A0S7XM65_9BACT|nr:MAG: hypothetical protein AMK68_03830 [candidate division KD3-62 bacterium DG_56]
MLHDLAVWLSHQDGVVWLGAVSTLAIYSILYRENPVFRFFEHIFVGVATGYGVQLIVTQVLGPMWWEPMVRRGAWYWIFALLAASLFYFVYSRRLVWMSRLIIGVFMGLTAGNGLVGFVTLVGPQVAASIKPVVVVSAGVPRPDVNHLLFMITLITVMFYFYFSISHAGRRAGAVARVGRWLVMVTFGSIFGLTVMGRMSLLIDRLSFLLFDWLHLRPPG